MNERDKELAEQCVGIRPYDNSFDWEKFAELIRADEREECAKVCEKYIGGNLMAMRIRARGKAK